MAGQLQSIYFETNSCDLCVANKVIHGKECTITWHVGNLKILHKELRVIGKITNQPESCYGKLRITRRRNPVYAGMGIEYCIDQSVEILMKPYLQV